MKKITALASAVAMLCAALPAGCIKDRKETPLPSPGEAVKFSTTIHTTRAYDKTWETGDQIGVYMLPASSSASTRASDTPLAENKLYTHDSTSDSEAVIFSGKDEGNTIRWPKEETEVDFVAYYPYLSSEKMEDGLYPIDLSDQSVTREIDLMHSANVKGVSEGNPALVFEHMLTGLVFNVVDSDGISLKGMKATFEGLPSSASFELVTGSLIPDTSATGKPFDGRLDSTRDGDGDGVHESATVTAIVLPAKDLDYSVAFTLASGESAVFSLEGVTYEAGKRYIYDIVLSSAPRESVDFGAEGTLSSITGWVDVKDEDAHDIIKNDEGADTPPSPDNGEEPSVTDDEEEPPLSGGEAGKPWLSGELVSDPDPLEYTVLGNAREATDGIGTGLRLTTSTGTVTITKDNYQGGISSVSVYIMVNFDGNATIQSVKVGDVSLLGKDGKTEVTVGRTDDKTIQLDFTPPSGELLSGTVEIKAKAANGSFYITQFGIN